MKTKKAQSILITGCSSGIGYHAAVELKKRGYRVFASARKNQDIQKLKEERFETVSLDINDSASIQKAVKAVVTATGGTLDAIFNNAGYIQVGAISDLSREVERAQFETNTFGPMELIREVLPIMLKQGHGRIIQNSSMLGIVAMPYYGAYNASKFALEGFSNTLRQELRNTSIHVSIINPGPIKTKLRDKGYDYFHQSIDSDHSDYKKAYKQIERSYFNPSGLDAKLALTPEACVKKLIHALESKRPKAHYFVGLPAHLFAILRRLLPDSALDWVIAQIR